MSELSEMSPVELLRAAAARVRERAKEAPAFCDCRGSEQRWQLDPHPTDDALVLGQCGCEMGAVAIFFGFRQDAGRWAELMHPGLAEPLAAALDYAARTAEYLQRRGHQPAPDGWTQRMIAVARVLLGVPDVE